MSHLNFTGITKTSRWSEKYLNDAPFVLFSGRTRGGYDWITVKSFLSNEMADEENDIYRNLFGDIIQTYEVYDLFHRQRHHFMLLHIRKMSIRDFSKEWAPPFIGS